MAKVLIEKLVKTYPEKSGPGVTAVKGIDLIIEDRDAGSLAAAVRARGADGLVGNSAVRHLAAVLTITQVTP